MRIQIMLGVLSSLLLVACNNTGNTDLVSGDFSIAYVDRSINSVGNPTDAMRFVPGGDLYVRDLSSPSSPSRNVTSSYTHGQGDVSDPEVSYDGKRLLFAMRGPSDTHWNIWEYILESGQLHRVISDDAVAAQGDDVDPAYLPDGRIVFASNRQQKSRELLTAADIEAYAYRDEYEREASIVLHVMNADGTDIHQISFNQSHDRNPTVLMSGQILFARWDHVANRNHFPLFTTDPDGTNIFVQYGAFSPGNSFLHPREMADGRVMSSLMPLSRTNEGGALVVVDVKNFSDNDEPASGAATSAEGQYQPTLYEITLGRGYSEKGRYTTPYPLWDGTQRALVSFKANPPLKDAVMVPNPLTGEDEAQERPPEYGIYMFDLETQSLRPIVLAKTGRALTDAVAIMSRPTPNIVPDKSLAGPLATAGMGILNVKSVYDTDRQGLMASRVLVSGAESIPQLDGAADIASLKDPAVTTSAAQRPARFVRVTKAVATPPGISMDTIGEADFEMQQILGYTMVEPDGSFRIQVPADTPLGLTVLDASGRALQTHTNWIQVRPGETRTCNGCHSPRRGSAINSSPIAGNHPNTQDPLTALPWPAESGESMAETRTRLYPAAMNLQADISYEDLWTDPGVRARDASFSIDYSGLTLPGTAMTDLAQGVINYPEHIQPLWDAKCASCHSGVTPAGELNLSNSLSGTGRLNSYDEVMIGDPVLDGDGLPILQIVEDEIMVQRETPLVDVGNSSNSSRTSHLIEVIFNQELRAEQTLAGTDHSAILNASEKRLVTEWVDLGAQYYNDPFEEGAADDGFRSLSELRGSVIGLDEDVFADDVHPILMNRCAACHQAFGSTASGAPTSTPNPAFAANRFVLTGNLEGDFNVTTTMVNSVCDAANSDLAKRPASLLSDTPPHPELLGGGPILAAASAELQTIINWIDAAAAANDCP